MRYTPIQNYLMEYAPTFCWCTRVDLFKLVEQIDENVSWESFKIVLFRMHRAGKFISRVDPHPERSQFSHTDPVRRAHSTTKQYILKPWRPNRCPVSPIPFKRVPDFYVRINSGGVQVK